MPFQDGIYYPYTSDAHSSAGIPSLLNSPLPPTPAPAMTPSSGASAGAMLPFRFRPRRESVDWRRLNAVDVDLVVSQLDVDALQEHVGAVAFCSLDGERCPHCKSPVDPALVKLLRLAQLTVEWVLHCQEFLALNLRAAEERLAAAGREREQLLAERRKQEEKEKELTTELKQRKKVIRTQQSLLAPQIIGSHKCLLCDKSFLNSAFLQNHMQRRHPDKYKTQLQTDGEKRSQIDGLKSEISTQKEQITQLQQALQNKAAQEKEQQSVYRDLLRELERFKAEEMARMERKIEDSRDGMRREMEFLYNRNIQALNEVNQNQPIRQEKPVSPVHSQPERDIDTYKEMQMEANQRLEQQIRKQDKKWESRLQEIQTLHESEKSRLLNELSRMQSSVSEQQERSQRTQQEMGRRLQDMKQTIKAQKEQIRSISSNPPTKVVEVPVIVSTPPPEPKQKRVILEEPASTLKLDPIQELSEEDRDSSSISERKPAERKPEPAPEKKARAGGRALKSNADIKREMRPKIKQLFAEKLESFGVQSDRSGLKKKELASILAKLQSKQEAKAMPDYWRQREDIASAVERKLGVQRRGSEPSLEARSRQPVQVLQIRPRSSSLPSRASQPTHTAVRQPKTPQPAPRSKAAAAPQPKTSTPNSKTATRVLTVRTPPFSSDEEEETDAEERPSSKQHRGKSPQLRANPLQVRGGKPSPAPVTKTVVTKIQSEEDDDDEWSEVSELHEIDPKQLQSSRDQNGNVERRSQGKESKINSLARKMEKQITERVLKKPAGGVSVLPERKDEVQELTYTDLEESSDWVVSSLEDGHDALKPGPLRSSGPLRKSLDSPSTSVWGTSTGKAPRSGLTDAGAGSTLKSSLCSLSDISDSEDLSKKT